jgi:hypothetical protein
MTREYDNARDEAGVIRQFGGDSQSAAIGAYDQPL